MKKETRENIKQKLEELIKKNVIKKEADLKRIRLDKLEQLAVSLDICPMDLIIYLSCGGDCSNCTIEYKIDCNNEC